MGNHSCPSCGFSHPSDAQDVRIEERVLRPSLKDIGDFLRSAVDYFGLSMEASIQAVLNATERNLSSGAQIEAPKPSTSVCPICLSLGFTFETANADEFNAHMSAGKHDYSNGASPSPIVNAIASPADVSPELKAILGLQ